MPTRSLAARILTFALALASAVPLRAVPATLTVEVDQPGHAISPALYGIFFEDINLSADGGIYPELVRNRSFEDAEQPESWTLVTDGGAQAEMTIDATRPLNPQNRRSLRLRVTNADGPVRLVNEGYWGMNVTQGAEDRLSLAARSADGFDGPLTVTIESQSHQPLAQGAITGLGRDWKTFALDLTVSGTDPKARLVISVAAKGTVWLDMVSLMPKRTWKDHGLRPDLCEMLDALHPSFMRFPGGCWVEGDDMAHMNHWKNTIGDVAHRIPLWNIWQYWATHGLGFHEYLQLAEDLGAEPLFCINVGMSHHEVIPLDQMGQWVQDALDAVEYANGPTNSVWGGQRARNGHPAPFRLKYLEIGNENGGPAYQERYALFHDPIKARYPEMILVADEPTRLRPADVVDEHYYSNPEFFLSQADRYDTYPRTGPKIFVGEYAVTQGCGRGNLRGAVGEAAFMTGMERNSDVVVMASYAPLFVNLNHKRWNPDLIGFDSSRAYGIPSYYVQKMFSENRGDVVLPTKIEVAAEPAPDSPRGKIGLGTWLTQAEYKDLRVTKAGQVLFASDFSKGAEGWRPISGNWKVADGAYRQTSDADNVQAHAGDPSWSDYTYTLKARKLGGAEGFLILFQVRDDQNWLWWNVGGWGNTRHAIERCDGGGKGELGRSVPGHVETGRWYDLRVELKGANIKCYLDGKLIHDATYGQPQPLYAVASQAKASSEVILKVVNASRAGQETEIKLNGARINPAAQAIVLGSEKPTDENTLDQPAKVALVTRTITNASADFRYVFPGNSVSVLRLKLAQ